MRGLQCSQRASLGLPIRCAHAPLAARPQRSLVSEHARSCSHFVRHSRASKTRASATATLPTDGPAEDTKYFWRIVIPTAVCLLLCNMDRICMSVAVLPMSKELGWSPSIQGQVQAAFLWGYMATQLLGGTLADRYGGKTVIAWAIVFFSLASLALPLVLARADVSASLLCVMAVRFAGALQGSCLLL